MADFSRKATKQAQKEQGGKKYRCSNCFKVSPKPLPACQRCKVAAYCDRDCQSKHWKEHKSLCITIHEIHKKAPAGASESLAYGHSEGRVHPLEDKIRHHDPVKRNEGKPDIEGLKKLCSGKTGKTLTKLIPKLYRKNLHKGNLTSQAEIKSYVDIETSNVLEGWKVLTTSSRKEIVQQAQAFLPDFFSMLVFNPGMPQQHSLHHNADLLLELYALWGGDLALREKTDGRGLIHCAAVEGLTDIIPWLVKEGVDPNQATGYSVMGSTTMSTPLHLAIMHMRSKAIQSLCSQPGIDANRRNLSGKTPLHCLANHSENDPTPLHDDRGGDANVRVVLETLLGAGADPRALVDGSWEGKSLVKNLPVSSAVSFDGMNLADMANNTVMHLYCISNGILPSQRFHGM